MLRARVNLNKCSFDISLLGAIHLSAGSLHYRRSRRSKAIRMPISGPSSPPKDDGPYFKSLDELDSWFKTPHERLDGVLPYVARTSEPESSGRLLVRRVLIHNFACGSD